MAEEFRNVSVVFAEDHKNNIYKIARFTEKGLGDDYDFWSHINGCNGYSFNGPYDNEVSKSEHFLKPITCTELLSYMRGHSDVGSRQVVEMLNMAQFSIPIKAFHYVVIESDIAHGFETFEYRQITRSTKHLGYEILFPTVNEQLALPGANSEFYSRAYIRAKGERRKYPVHYSHEYMSEWCYNHNSVKEKIVDNDIILSGLRECKQSWFLCENDVEIEPIDEALAIGWTFADESNFKLTPDGIRYTKIKNAED
jgi:hypothetical protein